jgi:valyl-tRNA synthetase
MSKSLGNSPDPIEIMEKYGADALRFVLLMLAPTGQDINFGEEMVETGQHFCNKIWNATRLLFSHPEKAAIEFPHPDPAAMAEDLAQGLTEADPEGLFRQLYENVFGGAVPGTDLAPLRLEDRWILQVVTDAASSVGRAIETRRLNDAARGVYDVFWKEFCDWYLEAIKPRLQSEDGAERRTALLVALTVHGILLRILHPFLPILSEELWDQHPASEGFCMISPFPTLESPLPFAGDAARFSLVKELVGAARNLRHEWNVPPGKRGRLLLRTKKDGVGRLRQLERHLAVLAKLEEVSVEGPGEKPARSVAAVVGEVEMYLPIDGLVDLSKEETRLRKELQQTEERLKGLRAKLGNEKFLQRAPAEVVNRQRALAQEAEGTLEKLRQQLTALE